MHKKVRVQFSEVHFLLLWVIGIKLRLPGLCIYRTHFLFLTLNISKHFEILFSFYICVKTVFIFQNLSWLYFFTSFQKLSIHTKNRRVYCPSFFVLWVSRSDLFLLFSILDWTCNFKVFFPAALHICCNFSHFPSSLDPATFLSL